MGKGSTPFKRADVLQWLQGDITDGTKEKVRKALV
jgi:hypothetical protein